MHKFKKWRNVMIPIRIIDSTWPPKDNEYYSTIILNYDDWNDYSYKTCFGMFFCNDSGIGEKIGNVKIYCWTNDEKRNEAFGVHTRESLSSTIEQLDMDFCSLGQELSYYDNLKRLFPNEYMKILKRLNDIAIFDDIKNKFINEHGVKVSLLRFSSAEKALNEAKEILKNEVIEKNISFDYTVKMPYDCSSVKLHFDFTKNKFLPYRINVLIGKNGTGKTRILTSLANSLSGYTDYNEVGCFTDKRPPVDKVLSISFSAFDSFRKPPNSEERNVFSYVYCGIQSEKGTLSLQQLKENLKKAYVSLKTKGRKDIWESVLSELMEDEHRETVKIISQERFDDVCLSSGQQILICTITELIDNIENESIILFDEPEIHLHPNAIANIIRMFYKLLEEFNSYAIFSTHSPILLQEIPSRYIQALNRVDNMLTVRNPDIECFGNNISDIVFDIFDVKNVESNFKTCLTKLSKSKTYDEICELFNGKLSLNALIYLNNCYNEERLYEEY